MRALLLFISLALLLSSYPICNLFYIDNIESWYDLHNIINSIIIILILNSFSFKKTKLSELLLILYCGIVVEDILDRLFFDIYYYEFNDFIVIAISLFFAYKKYIKYDRY